MYKVLLRLPDICRVTMLDWLFFTKKMEDFELVKFVCILCHQY